MLFRYQTALAVLLGFCVVLPNCTLDNGMMGVGAGSGGGTGSGGLTATGGTGSGGQTASGGQAASGGQTASGGTGSGGTTGSGGDGEGGVGGDGGTLPSKVIYLTATPVNSNFGGVVGADSACNTTRPNAGTYKALIVDGTTRVACTTANCGGGAEGTDWVLAADTSYGRPDGTLIGTTNGAGIFVFPLDAGIVAGELSYWTGLMGDWTTSDDTCSGWTSTSGSVFADEGLGGFTDSSAIRGVSDNCGLPKAFFACVEQ